MSDDWNKVEIGDSWKPEKKGDEVMGLLIDVQEATGPHGSTMYTIQKGDENTNIWGSTVLDNRMKRVPVGDEVRIIYKGMVDSEQRKGAKYKDFDVYHRKPSENFEDIL